MKTFFFTFGQNAFAKRYVGVIAPDTGAARHAMFNHFGEKWAFQYDAPTELRKQSREFGLTPLIHLRVQSNGSVEQVSEAVFSQQVFHEERLAIETARSSLSVVNA